MRYSNIGALQVLEKTAAAWNEQVKICPRSYRARTGAPQLVMPYELGVCYTVRNHCVVNATAPSHHGVGRGVARLLVGGGARPHRKLSFVVGGRHHTSPPQP